MFESLKQSRKLSMIGTRILNRPLMMTEGAAAVVLDAVAGRLGIAPIGAFDEYGEEPTAARDACYEVVSGVAIVPVIGELVQRSGYLGAMSGLCAYGDLVDTVRTAAADENVHAVMLDLDTPGGEVSGLFDAADDIARACIQAGKPLWAYSNERAFSAGYALASVADRIIVSRTSGVGSIGVIAAHCDQSQKDAKDGIKVTFVTAGAYKADGNSHEPLADRAHARLQGEVDRLYGLFTDHVARYRGMPESDVKATEAGCFFGPAAVAEGLADDCMPFEDALGALVGEIQKQRQAEASIEAAEAAKGTSMAVNRAEALKRKLAAFGNVLTRADVASGVTVAAKAAAAEKDEQEKMAAAAAAAPVEETDEDKKPEDAGMSAENPEDQTEEVADDETVEEDKKDAGEIEEPAPTEEEIDEVREAGRKRAVAGGSTGSKPGLAANNDPAQIVKLCQAAGLPLLANTMIVKGASVADTQAAIRGYEAVGKVISASAALDPSLKTSAVKEEILAAAAGDENLARKLILDRVSKSAEAGASIESFATPGSNFKIGASEEAFDRKKFEAERAENKAKAMSSGAATNNRKNRR